MKFPIKTRREKKILLVSGITVLVVMVGTLTFLLGVEFGRDDAVQPVGHRTTTTQEVRDTLPTVDAAVMTKDDTMRTQLQYLIEEEKLAHDVYQTLYGTWGTGAFGNIQQSELSHQLEVLAVMEPRDIADPRSSQVGIFTNPDLQSLYTKLVAQGNQSALEAAKVGVAIEELDIGDLKKFIADTPAIDADVQTMLDTLLAGSERHLVAFTRQVDKQS